MPTDVPINLLKGDRVDGLTSDYSDALPTNMSGVNRPMYGSQGHMLLQPGLTEYGDGVGIDRGALWNERLKEHFRVSGNQLVKVAVNGVSTSLGAISGLDTASFPYSFNTQAVIADERMWLYDPTNGLVEIVDIDLGNPIDGVFIDGYYFLTDGEFIYHTDIADETSIDPLKFATNEFSPDPTLGVARTVDNKAMVFDRYSINYFINRANENFAFTRASGRSIKAGIVGTHCKAEMSGAWYIMGGRKEESVSIHVLGVGSYTKVASREVDKIIGQYTEAELAPSILEARVEDDISYLIVHLPNETLLFNESIANTAGIDSAWTILKSDVLGDRPWRGIHGLFEPRLGKWVYGDKRSSKLAILDETSAMHYGEIAEFILYTPLVHLDSASIDKLEIETIPGFTTDSDATVFVSLTYDGNAYGTEHPTQYGLPSQYRKRFIKHRLGYVADFVGFKLRGATRSRMGFGRALISYG